MGVRWTLSCGYLALLSDDRALEVGRLPPLSRERASQVAQWLVKSLPANAGDTRDAGSIPGLGRSPGEVKGNPLQYSCLENSMYRETDGLQFTGSQRVEHN